MYSLYQKLLDAFFFIFSEHNGIILMVGNIWYTYFMKMKIKTLVQLVKRKTLSINIYLHVVSKNIKA